MNRLRINFINYDLKPIQYSNNFDLLIKIHLRQLYWFLEIEIPTLSLLKNYLLDKSIKYL